MQQAKGPFTEDMFLLQKQINGAQQNRREGEFSGILTPVHHCQYKHFTSPYVNTLVHV